MFFLAFILAFIFAVSTAGAVPRVVAHEGRLLRADGSPESGIVSITFSLHSAPSDGTTVWSETQAVTLSPGGYYAVQLGALSPLPALDGSDLWLQVQVGSEPPLAPRARLTSAAYALRAEVAARADDAASAGGVAAGLLLNTTSALDATRLVGTLSTARLPAEVPLLTAAQVGGLSGTPGRVPLLGADGLVEAAYLPLPAYAQLEGPSQTWNGNAWSPIHFNTIPVSRGIALSGGNQLTFARTGIYQITVSFRTDSGNCPDRWTVLRLFGNLTSRGNSAGTGTGLSPVPAVFTWLARVDDTSVNYQIQIGRRDADAACTPVTPNQIPLSGSDTMRPPAVVATIVQVD